MKRQDRKSGRRGKEGVLPEERAEAQWAFRFKARENLETYGLGAGLLALLNKTGGLGRCLLE